MIAVVRNAARRLGRNRDAQDAIGSPAHRAGPSALRFVDDYLRWRLHGSGGRPERNEREVARASEWSEDGAFIARAESESVRGLSLGFISRVTVIRTRHRSSTIRSINSLTLLTHLTLTILTISLTSACNRQNSYDTSSEYNQIREYDSSNSFDVDDAAAQFGSSNGTIEAFIQLNGRQIADKVINHSIYSRGPQRLVSEEHFRADGSILKLLDNVSYVGRYKIIGDALCVNMRRKWICRKIYKDGDNKFWQIFAGREDVPLPIELKHIEEN